MVVEMVPFGLTMSDALALKLQLSLARLLVGEFTIVCTLMMLASLAKKDLL
jgi:hypothetical protein